jgi:anti-repressor protein
MSEIQPYTFPATGQQIRTIDVNGQPWFVAADVCRVLGLTNATMSLRALDADEKGLSQIETPGGQQSVSIVSESGLYALIVRSDKPTAKPFRRWVTGEVLPALRRTGRYEVAQSLPQSYAEALRELASTVERAEEAEHRYAVAAPKAEAYSAFMDADGTYSFEQVAKMLLAETGLGRNNLFKRLRADGVLTDKNLPYQRYAHHFHVVASSFEHSDGRREVTYTTRVRATGIEFLRRKLGVAVSDVVTTEEINA